MIRSEVLFVGPELAEEFLRKNTKNYRKYRPWVAKKYADDMRNNRWKINGESICFNSKGELVNGQHRLEAIVMTGITIPIVVVYDVDDEVVTFDIGFTRSSVDIARAMDSNNKYSTNLLAIASQFVSDFGRLKLNTDVPSEYAVKFYKPLSAAFSSVCNTAGSLGGAGKIIAKNSGCGLAAYVWIRSGIPSEEIAKFFSVVNSGYQVDGVDCSPAITLRNTLLSYPIKSASYAKELYSAAFQAINDYIRQQPRRREYPFSEKPFEELSKFQIVDGVYKE